MLFFIKDKFLCLSLNNAFIKSSLLTKNQSIELSFPKINIIHLVRNLPSSKTAFQANYLPLYKPPFNNNSPIIYPYFLMI